ncbi:hypothetical protein, partial [Escherichia coli]|uniref:hypothetical protein n=1 Tax=Escherichia coli TaxID=562 RepID=UPI0028DE46FE
EAPEDLQAVSQANFQSTILLGVIHIDGREHPAHRVKSIHSPEGQETARYFARGDDEKTRSDDEQHWVGFAGEDFDAFLAL